MAKPHERFFALFLAILFLVSSVGVTAFFILQMRQEGKTRDLQDEATKSSQQTDTANQTETTNNTEATTLEGTKLNNFSAMATVDKLQYVDLVQGTGEVVKEGATVTAHYTGAYSSDGTIFQSSHDGPNKAIEFPLSGVIPGWTQGVPGMKVGGTRRLIIPGNLAYGEAPAGYTQGSTSRPMGPLVFDIEITVVKNP